MGTANKNSCKTAAVMNLLGKGSPSPSQEARVLPDQPRDIETITEEIIAAKLKIGENLFVIGRGLIEAKAQLPHGEWLPWLTMRVEFSEATAQNYMKLVRKYSNPEALRDLGYTKALLLLSLPDGTREEYIETTHIVDGEEKTVAEMSSRELKAALKERDDALRTAAQARADQSAAEQAREKMARDMAVANERLAGLNAEVEEQSAKVRDAQAAAARLEQELAELRSKPVDVAVQVDETAVEAARKETEAAMRAELDEAKKAQAEAEKARKAAEDAKAAAQMEVVKANSMLEEARRQAEEARKKTAVTTDPDLVLFSELLDQAQTAARRMGGVRMKKKDKDPEAAGRLQAALLAFSSMVKEVALQ